MPEGVSAGGRVIGEGVFTDPKVMPPPDPERAPKGWIWSKENKRWQPGKYNPRKGKDQPRSEADAAGTTDDRAGKDPDPGWMRDDKWSPPKGKLKFEDVPQEIKNDITGVAGLVGIPVLGFIRQVDPYCGGALAQQYEEIVLAMLPLICKSEKIVRYFSGDSDLMIWLGLGLALKPVATAIYQHHIARTVETYTDEHGMRRWRPRVSEGGDHLVPPVQPEYDYSA